MRIYDNQELFRSFPKGIKVNQFSLGTQLHLTFLRSFVCLLVPKRLPVNITHTVGFDRAEKLKAPPLRLGWTVNFNYCTLRTRLILGRIREITTINVEINHLNHADKKANIQRSSVDNLTEFKSSNCVIITCKLRCAGLSLCGCLLTVTADKGNCERR